MQSRCFEITLQITWHILKQFRLKCIVLNTRALFFFTYFFESLFLLNIDYLKVTCILRKVNVKCINDFAYLSLDISMAMLHKRTTL